MKLGQILLHRRKIGRDQLREGLRRQHDTGRPLGEILVGMGIVSRREVIDALRLLPTGSIGRRALEQVRRETATLISGELAIEHRCLPVVQTPGALVVALADPLDTPTIEAIEASTGLPVIPIAAPVDALDAAIEEHHGPDVSAAASPMAGEPS